MEIENKDDEENKEETPNIVKKKSNFIRYSKNRSISIQGGVDNINASTKNEANSSKYPKLSRVRVTQKPFKSISGKDKYLNSFK